MVQMPRTYSRPDASQRAHARLTRYFQEAARLRLCLAYNLEDYRFAQAGGRIVYLFDANIIRFFMDPEPEAERVVAFRSHPTPDYASATALVTAEFLFSRELAGQKSSPAFIAPAHGDEIADMIENLVSRRSQDPSEGTGCDASRESVQAMLGELVADISAGKIASSTQAADRLRQIVPGLTDLLLDEWVPLQQLRRLYDRDLVRPLALHPGATSDILWPAAARVKDWTARIQRERPPSSSGRSSKRDARDAEALLQVMMLDEAAATSDDPEPVKYVLVTADSALYSAYAKWYWNEGVEGDHVSRRRRFVLRDPLQYVPILNMVEMPNGVSDSTLSHLAIDALDSLFANLRAVEKSFPHKLAYYRILAQDESIHEPFAFVFGYNPLVISEADESNFLALRESWHRSFRTGVLLNINLVQRRLRTQFDQLLEVMESNHTIRQSIEQDQQRNLEKIQYAHAVFSTKMNVVDLIEGTKFGSTTIIPRERIPFLLRSDRLNLPEQAERLLKEEATAAEGEQLNAACRRALETNASGDALSLAAAVAYRCGHWSAARIYARQAIARVPERALRLELDYILASSVRHGLGSIYERSPGAADLQEADQALEHSIRRGDEDKDDFACARAMVERVALLVNHQRRRAIVAGEPPLDPGSPGEMLEQAAKCGTLLLKLVRELRGSGIDEALVATLVDHVTSLSISALTSVRIFGTEPPDGAVVTNLARLEAIVEARGPEGDGAPPMTRAYRLANWIRDSGASPEAAAALEALRALVAAASDDPWLSELDRAELDRLLEVSEETARSAAATAPEPLIPA